MPKLIDFNYLKGKVIESIEINLELNFVSLKLSDDTVVELGHRQTCCGNVYIDDIDGDKEMVLNSKITKALKDVRLIEGFEDGGGTKSTFTIETRKGHLSIKWIGVSDGVNSEKVDVRLLACK